MRPFQRFTMPQPSSVSSKFDYRPMYHGQILLVVVNAIGCIISLVTGSHVHLDVIGIGLAFVVAVIFPLMMMPSSSHLRSCNHPLRVCLSSGAIVLWAVRLSILCLMRALDRGHDARLDSQLSTNEGIVQYWTIVIIWGILTLLPHSLGTSAPDTSARNPLLSKVAVSIGSLIYGVGFIVETIADQQKWICHHQESESPIIPPCYKYGLWSIVQHPNYLGEYMIWFGIAVMHIAAVLRPRDEGRIQSTIRMFTLFVGPTLVTAFLAGQATGYITNARETARNKYGYGVNEEYTHYVDTTPLFVPHFSVLTQIVQSSAEL